MPIVYVYRRMVSNLIVITLILLCLSVLVDKITGSYLTYLKCSRLMLHQVAH